MTKTKVYHVKNPSFEPNYSLNLSDFILVAEIDSQNADIAFNLTQNIDSNWVENERVKAFVGDKCRSTSVGDLVEINKKYFICNLIGWEILEFADK